jgi:hypothetical protein
VSAPLDWLALGGLLTSMATLVLSALTYRWTQRQKYEEVFDLVTTWKRADVGTQSDGLMPFLCCHNRSDRSIFVTKIEYLRQNWLLISPGWKGLLVAHPFDDPLPVRVEPDQVAEFPISVSAAIETLKSATLIEILFSKLGKMGIFVRMTTASGAVREVNAIDFVPTDVRPKWLASGVENG